MSQLKWGPHCALESRLKVCMGGGGGTGHTIGTGCSKLVISLHFFSSEAGSTVLFTLTFDLYVLCTKFKKKIIYKHNDICINDLLLVEQPLMCRPFAEQPAISLITTITYFFKQLRSVNYNFQFA